MIATSVAGIVNQALYPEALRFDQIGNDALNFAIGLPFLLGVGPLMIPVELAVLVLAMISTFAFDIQRTTDSGKR